MKIEDILRWISLGLLASVALTGVKAQDDDDDSEEDGGNRPAPQDNDDDDAPVDDDDDSSSSSSSSGDFSLDEPTREVSDEVRIFAYYQSVFHYEPHHFDVADIDGTKMTHFAYAFLILEKDPETGYVYAVPGQEEIDTELIFNPETEECDCCAKGSYRQAYLLKRKNPHLRTIISLGGWSQSMHFSDAVHTEEHRRIYAESVIKYMIDYEFDGIDIDWEFPVANGDPGNGYRPEDGKNLGLFIKELRRQFVPYEEIFEKKYELTVALPAEIQDWMENDPEVLDAFHNHVDYILVMGYEFNWGSSWARHHANLYQMEVPEEYVGNGFRYLSAQSAMEGYLSADFTKNQLVLGVAAYCREFVETDEGDNGDGLLGVGEAAGELIPYNEQESRLGGNGYDWHFDDTAVAGWYYSSSERKFYTCEDPVAVKAKSEFVNEEGYGGIMLWDLSSDFRNGEDDALIEVIAANLEGTNLSEAVERGLDCPDDGEYQRFCNMGCQEDEEELEKRVPVNGSGFAGSNGDPNGKVIPRANSAPRVTGLVAAGLLTGSTIALGWLFA